MIIMTKQKNIEALDLEEDDEIKAKHANVNVYLNTLVDEAISFYYDHLFSRNAKS
jgi:hypothetical protein